MRGGWWWWRRRQQRQRSPVVESETTARTDGRKGRVERRRSEEVIFVGRDLIPCCRGTTVHAVGRPFGVGERPSSGEPSDRFLSLSSRHTFLLLSSPSPPASLRSLLHHAILSHSQRTRRYTPRCALRRDASRWRRHRLCESQGMLVPRIRTASPKSISLVEKKGEKEREKNDSAPIIAELPR